MKKKMHSKGMKTVLLGLSVGAVLATSSPSWAQSHRYHAPHPQVSRCADCQDCSGSRFSPHSPRRPAYDLYNEDYYYGRDYYDDRDYGEERPYYYPDDSYNRPLTLPAPQFPRGTGQIIEGLFDLLSQGR